MPFEQATVEVFVNGEWFIVQHLPNSLRDPKCYVHNGTLIVADGFDNTGYCRCVQSLLASCVQSQCDKKVPASHDLWKRFDHPGGASFDSSSFSSILSFQQRLVGVLGDSVEILCPFSNTWMKLGNLPKLEDGFSYIASTVLATGDMAIMLESHNVLRVYTASLRSMLRLA